MYGGTKVERINIKLADAKIVAKVHDEVYLPIGDNEKRVTFYKVVIQQDDKVVHSLIVSTTNEVELEDKFEKLLLTADKTVTAKDFIYMFEGLEPESFSIMTIDDKSDAEQFLKKYM